MKVCTKYLSQYFSDKIPGSHLFPFQGIFMHNTPLFRVLQSLGKRERAELTRWVESPFVNRRPEVARLCAHLCQLLDKDAPGEAYRKTVLWNYLTLPNPQSPINQSSYDDAAMRHTMSFLFRTVKQWLAYREWAQDDTAINLHLVRTLRKKGLTKVFAKEFKNFGSSKSLIRQSIDFHLVQYQIQFEHWEAEHRTGRAETRQLESASAAFGAFVASSALRHGCAALDQSHDGFFPENLDFLPETLAAVEAGRYGDVPAVQIYFHCFRLMQSDAEMHFQALKNLLALHTDLFPPEEIRDVYMVAVNFCIRQLNTGAREYVREAFDLYRSGLQRGIILDNGLLPKATYQNIMLLALALDEWQWARQFLENYRTSLAAGERHNAYHFNLALWHFRRKEYAQAQEILRRVEFRDVHYNLDARRMMVRMYFDTGEVAALESLLHSFRIYLQRHRNIGYHRELNFNFVRCVHRLLQLEPGDEASRQKLHLKILNEKYLAEREWLLEQTNS
ncbi:MAG: hypothetical protein DYG98_00370 [Haliscomenobacteraceae bacterium CHB4]|nr:hypothetical protein [Haliscomenobacteraceae bacterium CHB4]